MHHSAHDCLQISPKVLASQAVYISKPDDVARLIERVAKASAR